MDCSSSTMLLRLRREESARHEIRRAPPPENGESSPVDNGEGKFAVTHYKTIKRANGYSLVELDLETGRKNQIRVHMLDLGHPVVGDRRYGSECDPLGRLALHAFKLCFYHPVTKELMEFETPYPTAFKGLMQKK